MHATAFLKAPREHATGPIVVLSGTERFLKQAALQAVCETVLGAADSPDLTRITSRDADLARVRDSLRTISMWNPRQLVLVEDADDFVSEYRSGLEAYLEKPAQKGVLILDVKTWPSNTRLAKKAAQIGLPLECTPLKPADLVNWLIEMCRTRHSKKLERPAAQSLVDLAGTDLGLLDQELAKLSTFVGERPSIDAKVVESLVGGWKTETTWKMLDAARDGNVGAAIDLLDNLLTAGEPPLKLLGGINYQYRPLAAATAASRDGTPLQEALVEAGAKPFVIQASIAYLKRVGRPRAEQIYRWLLQADHDLKGASQLPERTIIERLILRLAGKG